MSVSSSASPTGFSLAGASLSGLVWLAIALLGAGLFFWPGTEALLEAWQLPEYSHGPLIPILSGLLFLRQLKEYPADPGPKRDRWAGVAVVLLAVLMGSLGRLANIDDIVAYALILWVGGLLLISFGWQTGKHFWPGVVHLVYMLPLPGVIYYKMTTGLQFVSSELGVSMLRMIDVPVYLDGNIIDLGVVKLHVAEACSGLRYLFPIMSFSYVFACLYRGPVWHKAVLLLAAVPITVVMNSVRIAIGGYIANTYGLDWLEGFTHFFEGWVIFIACVVLLFVLAWAMMKLGSDHRSLSEALDLEMDGLVPQFLRIRLVWPSAALITSAVLLLGAAAAFTALPERNTGPVPRDSFALFPRTLGEWEQVGPRQFLDKQVEGVLGADDYHQVTLARPGAAETVGLFMAWYDDQSKGGVHSPEVCLPGSGWEIAWLERTDVADEMGSNRPFELNRAIIQMGETRMMVYYWFQQKERRIAWDFEAKFQLMLDGIRTGRTDGALVRLTTLIAPTEDDAAAEARLQSVLDELVAPLPRFIPEGDPAT
ncbi:VPLPA-CTERM-specific exosortase XrtD [uncultured Jannaschia sp.]|uniref:VPLPA-CTERM-specific exosortase XrtD n=1 Tax=uncultured Jannaschia sp. TaxID=293347 RepID=UPI002606A85A|nr:VPLPA-CTERM-specific exosortase XrtD [uncultured Jannaschia sp.]